MQYTCLIAIAVSIEGSRAIESSWKFTDFENMDWRIRGGNFGKKRELLYFKKIENSLKKSEKKMKIQQKISTSEKEKFTVR